MWWQFWWCGRGSCGGYAVGSASCLILSLVVATEVVVAIVLVDQDAAEDPNCAN